MKMSRLLILFLPLLIFAQTVHLGNVHCGNVTLGTAGQAPPPSKWNQTGAPVHGGYGYPDTLPTPSGNESTSWIVDTYNELTSAISAAGDGDTVFIEGDAEIELTDKLIINNAIILGSTRGRIVNDTLSWGALLYRDQGIEDIDEIIYFSGLSTGDSARVTGLRLRNGNSMRSNHSTSDSVDSYILPADDCIYITSYGHFEVDNCEIAGGWGCAIRCRQGDLHTHHNWYTDGWNYYQGYAINYFQDSTSVLSEGNWYSQTQYNNMAGGGTECEETHAFRQYDVHDQWALYGAHDFHSDGDSACTDTCEYALVFITKTPDIGRVMASGHHPNRDSCLFRYNSIGYDSSVCWNASGGFKLKCPNNYYGSNGDISGSSYLNGEQFPVAVITCSDANDTIDAGDVVTFDGASSYDPDGIVYHYYWDMGDSVTKDSNYARQTLLSANQQVTHRYNQPGLYTITLTVTDNEGVYGRAYKYIVVEPTDGKNWLTFWYLDRCPTREDGYYDFQLIIEGDTVLTRDVAGGGTWEFIKYDATSYAQANDSIDIRFQLTCVRDTSDYFEPWIMIDDVHLCGGEVVNGSFNSGTWSGNVYGETDGNWDGDWYDGDNYFYSCRYNGPRNTGKWVYSLYDVPGQSQTEGDCSWVEQTIDILGQ